MIKIDSAKATMEFGTGDIGMNTYMRTDIDEKGMIFYNQEPRKIGDGGDIMSNSVIVDMNDFPIKMVFTKIESVDVVIDMLEELKVLINSNSNTECPCMREKSLNCGMKCSNCGREL